MNGYFIFHFLRAFWFRRNGDHDSAEQEYYQAYNLDPQNFHVLRELATSLAMQGRFMDAEKYARAAFELVPTNPFIIDCLCEVIIEKADDPSKLQYDIEFQKLMRNLERYGDLEHRSFYENRQATYLLRIGQLNEALHYAEKAVQKTNWRFGAYITRANVRLRCRQVEKVFEDIEKLRRLASDLQTGEGKAERFLVDKLEIRYQVMSGNYQSAKELLERYKEIPTFVKDDLSYELANRILDDQTVRDWKLTKWAEDVINGRYAKQ